MSSLVDTLKRKHPFLTPTVKALLFADEPTKEEANKHLYREGMLWGKYYKPAIHIGDKSILEHAVDCLSSAGFSVTIVGDPAKPYELLGDSVQYNNPGHSMGDKLRALSDYGDELIVAGGCDIYPTKKDAKGLYDIIQQHKDDAFIAPMVRGQCLVDIGFRSDIRTKIYHLLDDGDQSERLAFPQLYAIRPARFRLDTAACVADKWYKNREDGCNQSYLPLLKEYFREKHTDDSPGFVRTIINTLWLSTQLWMTKRHYNDLPVLSYKRTREVVAGLVGRCSADELVIVPTDLRSMACDIDTEEELAIVRDLVEKGEW